MLPQTAPLCRCAAFPPPGGGITSRGRLGLPLMVSELVHLLRDAGGWVSPQSHLFSVHQGHPLKLRIRAISPMRDGGLCGSVDSICVFNTGDGTGGALYVLLPAAPQETHLSSREKRMCPRGMSASTLGQFRFNNRTSQFLKRHYSHIL